MRGYYRIFVLYFLLLLCAGGAVRALYVAQVVQGADYHAQAVAQNTRAQILPAARGEICDRTGQVLVGNAVQYDLHWEGVALSENDRQTLRALVQTYGGTWVLEDASISEQTNTYTIATDLPPEAVLACKARMDDLQGITLVPQVNRTYPLGIASHILGRTGAIYAEEWESYRENGYQMNEIVGKDGLELQLEPYLRGTAGYATYLPATTKEVKVQPTQGDTCILTLDANLQQACEQALENHLTALPQAGGGAAVVLEVRTGRVLAMASYPTYDLSTFSRDYPSLVEDGRSPLFNRALQGLYPPGSTFKMVTAVAALEEGVLQPQETYECMHNYTRYTDRTFTCMGTHGALDVVQALGKSCNVFFYEMGYRVGGQALEDWAHKLGLGESTGIALAGEAVGQVAGPQNRARMQAQKPYYEDWQGGDVLQAAIGQSDTVCTPLQMARYLAALVNGGVLYQPYLVERVVEQSGRVAFAQTPTVQSRLEVSRETLELVRQGMGAVMQAGGTAGAVFADYPITVGGKSGTAQTGQENRADNGVFLAFAPYTAAEIAICVVGEGAGGGAKMAPVVREILDAYFAGKDAAG